VYTGARNPIDIEGSQRVLLPSKHPLKTLGRGGPDPLQVASLNRSSRGLEENPKSISEGEKKTYKKISLNLKPVKTPSKSLYIIRL
jgi:hypothetical protein